MMNTPRRAACAALVIVYLSGSGVHARRVADWEYDRLLAYSDVVVIATTIRCKRASFDFATVEPWASWLRDLPELRNILVAEITTFQVKAVLKGRVEGRTIEVFHFTLTGPLPNSIQGGPILFKEGLAKEKGGGEFRPTGQSRSADYLLFLKGRTDGLFDPVTGQVDSAYSVKQIRSLVDP